MPDQPWAPPDSRTCGGSPRRARPTVMWPTWPRREHPTGWSWCADHQTAGRGRLDRAWVAPPDGSLLLSVLVRPDVEPASVPLLTVAMALAVVEAARSRHVAARLKWPNDVVVDGDPPRKLAGILAESMVDAGGSTAAVVGVGVNVNWPTPLPPELEALASTATALNLEAGADVDREDVLVAVLPRLRGPMPPARIGRPRGVQAVDRSGPPGVRHPGPSGARRSGSPIGGGPRRRPGRTGGPDRGRRPRRAPRDHRRRRDPPPPGALSRRTRARGRGHGPSGRRGRRRPQP